MSRTREGCGDGETAQPPRIGGFARACDHRAGDRLSVFQARHDGDRDLQSAGAPVFDCVRPARRRVRAAPAQDQRTKPARGPHHGRALLSGHDSGALRSKAHGLQHGVLFGKHCDRAGAALCRGVPSPGSGRKGNPVRGRDARGRGLSHAGRRRSVWLRRGVQYSGGDAVCLCDPDHRPAHAQGRY